MTPEQYLDICEREDAIIEAAENRKMAAYEEAAQCQPPSNLRPAVASDIVEWAIIWYPDNPHTHAKWHAVEEVRWPDDPFKAYIYQGARYGLHGAFVEVRTEDTENTENSEVKSLADLWQWDAGAQGEIARTDRRVYVIEHYPTVSGYNGGGWRLSVYDAEGYEQAFTRRTRISEPIDGTAECKRRADELYRELEAKGPAT